MASDLQQNRFIRVRGAREHNLKNVDVDIPRDALVVFSGVSGSGKSSLAFGTLYAEAQRRYFESVAPYARRLIDQVGVPDVDSIEGLPPAVALQQQRGTPSTRSSVGSVTTLSSFVRMLYSRCGIYPPHQPMLYAEDFSPNTPQGACAHCHGLGHVFEVTEKTMVPDDSLTIRERAVAAWPPAWHGQNLRDILVTLGYDVDTPWRALAKKDRDWILFTDEQPTVPVYAGFSPAETRAALRRKTEPSYQGTFTGARKYVLHTFATTQSALMKKRVSRFMHGSVCPVCDGMRLKREALSVTFAGLDIGRLSQLPLNKLAALLEPVAHGQFDLPARSAAISRAAASTHTARRVAAGGSAHQAAPDVRRTPNLSEEKRIAAQRIAHDLLQRIATLQELGLGYLSLDRGPPPGLQAVAHSRTAAYLFKAARGAPLHSARTPAGWLELRGIRRNNLRGVDARFALGMFTAVTGISGSGKSSLVSQALVELVAQHLGHSPGLRDRDDSDDMAPAPGAPTGGHIGSGMQRIKRLVQVDQRPIGRTPRSNLATYTGLFDHVRKLFAGTKGARARHFDAGRFSFNVAKGRCETCEGEGFVGVELLFMPSVYAPCPTCHGARYNEQTLKVTWQDKNIAEVLRMTVDQACAFFAAEENVRKPLALLQNIGLGYLRLGQPATELSGGEAQRIKLATELQRPQRGDTLYVLDEPTTGLHPADVDKLMAQLQGLVDSGNTVVVVEHDMRVVAASDWVIDVGPGAGDDGGRIVACGPPQAVCDAQASRTGPYLRKWLQPGTASAAGLASSTGFNKETDQ